VQGGFHQKTDKCLQIHGTVASTKIERNDFGVVGNLFAWLYFRYLCCTSFEFSISMTSANICSQWRPAGRFALAAAALNDRIFAIGPAGGGSVKIKFKLTSKSKT